MSVTWKINGTDVKSLGIERAMLRFVNQQADTFTFENPAIEFDTNAAYTSAPVVVFSGGGGSGAAATASIASGVVSALSLDAAGTGYTSAPLVAFSGGGSFGATARAVLTPTTVASATLSAAGSGFTSAPTVTVSGGGGSGAAFTAVLATRAVATLALTSGGTGYSSAPTVTLSGGGGTGATATAVLSSGAVVSLSLTGGGSGYTSAPAVSFSGGGGSGATATATLASTTVASVALGDAGTGFLTAPVVTVSGGGGTGAAVTAVLAGTSLLGITVSAGGSGYTSPPTVAISGGGGSGATAVALLESGAVVGITITSGGSGYTKQPYITLTGGGGSGAMASALLTGSGIGAIVLDDSGNTWYDFETPVLSFLYGGGSGAAGTPVLDHVVLALELGGFGSGYSSAPTVTISGGGGSGATATATLGTGSGAGKVSLLTVTSRGSGYTSTPTVTISGGGGSGAWATASVRRMITSVTITSAGTGYTFVPTARFVGTYNTYSATTTLVPTSVGSIVVFAGGSGYTSAPTVAFSGGGGTGAVATAAIGIGVASISLTAAGSGFTSVPTVTLSGGGGSGAAASAVLSPTSLASLTLTAAGSGYTSAPTLSIALGTGSGATAATATATLSTRAIASLALTAGGSGYSSAPTVAFSGGGGSGATATASVSVTVSSLTLTAAGTGYTSAPAVSFSGGGGSGADATAELTTAAIASLTLSAAGSGYTSAPTLTISGGGGTGGEAIAVLTSTSVDSLILTNNGGVLQADTAVVLTREEGEGDIPWFSGVIRETPRSRSSRDNRITYVAHGPWQWLERIAYLQTFKTAVDAADPASLLTTYQRGRVVIGQDDDGLKVSLGEFLNLVLDYAIAAKPGVMQRANFADALTMTIPWDEVTDLSCAEVISRALQFVPDAVCAWDYSTSPPRLNITRRADMVAETFAVQPASTEDSTAYAPLETIDLRERADLWKNGVYLLYLATNRENDAQWETASSDIYPVGTVASDPDTLFRTIQLAGAVVTGTTLTQKIDVDPLESYLERSSTSWLTSGSTFDSLKTWWQNHATELAGSTVTIRGFSKCTREGDSMGTSGQLDNELVAGAVTDWMEDRHNIRSEDQTVTAYVAFEEARVNDSSKKARHIKKFVATVRATNATTKTYSYSSTTSVTPAEEVPTGLALAIYNAINPRQWDGSLALVESEPSYGSLLGRVVNLSGSLTDWASMRALIQTQQIDLFSGKTALKVGPAKQLGPDDLTELYRVNRNRAPVTSYWVRSTGQSSSGGGSQGLGRYNRGGARATGIAQAPGRYTSAVSVAGTVPTSTEIGNAVAAAYSGDNIPVEGDVVSLTISGTVKFQAIVTLTAISADSWRRVAFTFSSVSYYAWVSQIGLL